jgi:hypothetical protein
MPVRLGVDSQKTFIIYSRNTSLNQGQFLPVNLSGIIAMPYKVRIYQVGKRELYFHLALATETSTCNYDIYDL